MVEGALMALAGSAVGLATTIANTRGTTRHLRVDLGFETLWIHPDLLGVIGGALVPVLLVLSWLYTRRLRRRPSPSLPPASPPSSAASSPSAASPPAPGSPASSGAPSA